MAILFTNGRNRQRGPFQEGPGKVKFLIVAMDYFTKWIEAKPVATITGNQITPSRIGVKNCAFNNLLLLSKSSNGDTPFSLTYGTEAVIPTEIGMPTFRTAEVNVAENDKALEINLELLEEKREQVVRRKKARGKWKNTTTPKLEVQVSSQETWCTRATKQAV
ncbi:reverse transcriptase domain-containing protein [Tanacetum coccineum]